MLTKKEYRQYQLKAFEMIKKSGIRMKDEEIENIEVADFGLNHLEKEGAQMLTFFNTKRVAAKVIALFPEQTEPEHMHIAVGDDPGKEETIRVIEGTLYFYIPGEVTLKHGFIPDGKDAVYTVRNELIMKCGDQITLKPGTKHWFQAGKEGAVIYTISSMAVDSMDPFTDPSVVRMTKNVD